MEQEPTTSVVHSKRQTLRANPTQTVVLQEAYAMSTTVNNEMATELHHKTGLPLKWITQWFARRRSKERKKATTSARGALASSTSQGLLTSSSDAGYSPSDAFQVKLEDRDNILSSRSSSFFTPLGTTESSHITNASGLAPQYLLDNQTSSSATVTRGRKRKQIIVDPDIPPPPPRKRGRKRNDYSTMPLQLKQVKQEVPEVPESLYNRLSLLAEPGVSAHTATFRSAPTTETPVLADPGVVAAKPSSNHPLQSKGSALHHTGFQIAPPKRSSKTPHRPRSYMAMNDPSSVVNFTSSRNKINSADATIEHQSVQHAGIISDPSASSTASFSLLNTGIYQRAPIFRMGFQNSGPDNFAVTSETTQRGCPDAPTSESQVASSSQTRPYLDLPVLGMPFSLQYGTDSSPFRNGDASGCRYAAFYDIRSTQTTHLQAWPSAFSVNNEAPQFDLSATNFDLSDPRLFPAAYELQSHDTMAAMDTCDLLPSNGSGFNHNTFNDVLDPSSAPLKHLVDLLEDFRDENGGFSRLLHPEEHPVLIQRLANQDLLEQNYFQAAMGHVLLIRLGLKAD